MIRHILWKDWILLWPMAALLTGIQVGLEWVVFSANRFGESAVAEELERPLTMAWFLGIAALTIAVVQQDPVPGADQDWMIRPLKRSDLLMAKVLFIVITVCMPMFLLNLAHASAMGFPLIASLQALFVKELWFFAFFMLPVLALAATTRNMTELALLGAALIVANALGTGVSALVLNDSRCPTCDTGLSWLEHQLQHAGVLGGALIILGLQYFRRRTGLSRALAVCGAAALVFLQLPWNVAFAIQQWVSSAPGTNSAILLESARDDIKGNDRGVDASKAPPAERQATRALLRGDVDRAVEFMRRRVQRSAATVLEVPVRVTGVSGNDVLLVDRAEVELLGSDGRAIYHGVNVDESPNALRPAPELPGGDPELVHQIVQIPQPILASSTQQPLQLRLEYSLTLMSVVSEHKMAAMDGELRSSEIGLCESKLDRDGVTVGCKQIGRAPFCYSATLYRLDGSHNPEISKCTPNYRPFGSTLSDTLSFFGVNLPVRDRSGLARYPIDASLAADAYVLLRIYKERDHFKRDLTTTNYRVLNARQ